MTDNIIDAAGAAGQDKGITTEETAARRQING
jgi:hypothetical protein